jgi:hypothetical protein
MAEGHTRVPAGSLLVAEDNRVRALGRLGRRRIRALFTTLVVVAAAAGGVTLAYRSLARQHVTSACTATSATDSQSVDLTREQAQNAAIIAAVALKKGLPDHAVTVALATALQESQLRNLPYGDLDSVGLFQQRPSQGWGTRTQLLDPTYAASAFYDRLVQIQSWAALPVTDAAQAVQQSATPTAYAGWEAEARTLAIALTGEVPAGFSCRLASFAAPAPPRSALTAAAVAELGSAMVGTELDPKAGWQVASWAVSHAWQYHILKVSFGSWSWTSSSGHWRQTGSPAPGIVQAIYGN